MPREAFVLHWLTQRSAPRLPSLFFFGRRAEGQTERSDGKNRGGATPLRKKAKKKEKKMASKKKAQAGDVAYTWKEEDVRMYGAPTRWVRPAVVQALRKGAEEPTPLFRKHTIWSDALLALAAAPLRSEAVSIVPALWHSNKGLYRVDRVGLRQLDKDVKHRDMQPKTLVAADVWPENDGPPSGVWGVVAQADAPPVAAWAALDGAAGPPPGLVAGVLRDMQKYPGLRLPEAAHFVRVPSAAAVGLLLADALSPRPTTHPAAFVLDELARAACTLDSWEKQLAQLVYLRDSAVGLGGPARATFLVPLNGRRTTLHQAAIAPSKFGADRPELPAPLRQLTKHVVGLQRQSDALQRQADAAVMRAFREVEQVVARWAGGRAPKGGASELWSALNRLEGVLHLGRYLAERHVYQHAQNTAAMNARACFLRRHQDWLVLGRAMMWPTFTLTAWTTEGKKGCPPLELSDVYLPVAHVWHFDAGLSRLGEAASKYGAFDSAVLTALADLWEESAAEEKEVDMRQVSATAGRETLWGTTATVLMMAEWLQTVREADLDAKWSAEALEEVVGPAVESLREVVRENADKFWLRSAHEAFRRWGAEGRVPPYKFTLGWAARTSAPETPRQLLKELATLDADALYAHLTVQQAWRAGGDLGALFAPMMLESATWVAAWNHEHGLLPELKAPVSDADWEALTRRARALSGPSDWPPCLRASVRGTLGDGTLRGILQGLSNVLVDPAMPLPPVPAKEPALPPPGDVTSERALVEPAVAEYKMMASGAKAKRSGAFAAALRDLTAFAEQLEQREQ